MNGIPSADFDRAWAAFKAQHATFTKPLSDEALQTGMCAAIEALQPARGDGAVDPAQSARNATLIEMLSATHEGMADFLRRLRAGPDKHSAATVGGWVRVVDTAIHELKKRADGWIASGMVATPSAAVGGRVGEDGPVRAALLLCHDALAKFANGTGDPPWEDFSRALTAAQDALA